jgi:hypothetical protein
MMRFLGALFGGLIGAIPGLVVGIMSGENLGLAFGGVLLILTGFIIGAVLGWKRSGWLKWQGVLGAAVGLVPGVIFWPLDLRDGPIVGDLHWQGIAMFILLAGFLIGLLIGNRFGNHTTTTQPQGEIHA